MNESNIKLKPKRSPMNSDLKFILFKCFQSSNGLRKCGAIINVDEIIYYCNDNQFDWNKSFRMGYLVHILKDGYSTFENGVYKANGTCTLIIGQQYKVIVDTLSAWDKVLVA